MQQIEKRTVKKSAGMKLAPTAPGTEEKVSAEIKKATDQVKSTTQKISGSVVPPASPSTEKVSPINLNSKLVKVMIIVLIVFVLLLVIGKIFQAFKNRSTNNDQTPVVVSEGTPTPTIKYEISVTPKLGESVYANDPAIAKMEEKLDILQNEISTTPLRESLLLPPTLDFKVSF